MNLTSLNNCESRPANGGRLAKNLWPQLTLTRRVQMMRTLVPDATPVIFSDDPESARQMLGDEYPNTIFIEVPLRARASRVSSSCLYQPARSSLIALLVGGGCGSETKQIALLLHHGLGWMIQTFTSGTCSQQVG